MAVNPILAIQLEENQPSKWLISKGKFSRFALHYWGNQSQIDTVYLDKITAVDLLEPKYEIRVEGLSNSRPAIVSFELRSLQHSNANRITDLILTGVSNGCSGSTCTDCQFDRGYSGNIEGCKCSDTGVENYCGHSIREYSEQMILKGP